MPFFFFSIIFISPVNKFRIRPDPDLQHCLIDGYDCRFRDCHGRDHRPRGQVPDILLVPQVGTGTGSQTKTQK